MSKRKKSTMWIAVVWRGPERRFSARPRGDYAAFVSLEKKDAVHRAMRANTIWGGGYEVAVGKLDETATEMFALKKLVVECV